MLRALFRKLRIGEEQRAFARQAFKEGDIARSKHAHDHHGDQEPHSSSAEYLGDFVLGGIDGIITTFAVVAGVVGANFSSGVIIVLGLANLLADGLSMAVGNFLGEKSDQEYQASERKREYWEVENLPEQEQEEIRSIYARKGFSGDLLEEIVSHITADKDRWVDTMMLEELQIIEGKKNPYVVGIVTFLAFVGFGMVPLLVYLIAFLLGVGSVRSLFTLCLFATGMALFLVGALRSRMTFQSWFKSGFEIFILGGLAGSIAYMVGAGLKNLGT